MNKREAIHHLNKRIAFFKENDITRIPPLVSLKKAIKNSKKNYFPYIEEVGLYVDVSESSKVIHTSII